MKRTIEKTSVSEPKRRRRSFFAGVREIYRHMSPARQHQLYAILILMLLNAVAELGTIGAILPFLALISHPESLRHYPWVLEALARLGAATQRDRLITTTVLFAAFAIVSGILRFQLARSTFSFAYEFAHELALEIQRRLLLQPYSFHVQRNTSTLISTLDKANILVFDVILPLIQAVVAAFISLFIVAILIAVDPLTAFVATIAFSAIYILASLLTKARLAANSEVISKGIDERLKIIKESLEGIRDVLIDGSQDIYLAQFDRENSKLGRARANTAVIALAPRSLVETMGIVAIATIALAASLRGAGFAAAIPALGAIALGAQRLLPLIQQVYRGWSTASGHLSVVGEAVDLLTLPVDPVQAISEDQPALPLREKISVNELSFTYPSRSAPTLETISFEVPAGSSLALVGQTGSGKSTLADLLMGLLDPSTGSIAIDGIPLTMQNRRQWQRNVAHVPQSIFLADTSIARNIALGFAGEEPDGNRIIQASKSAQLHDFVESLPQGYDTIVGERGIRLSGGQRQRLGLARAIYKRAPVFVLDEPTSAIDYQTEAAVISALQKLQEDGRTIIIVAHRLSTIQHCDLVARLADGKLVEFGPLNRIASLQETAS